jgi:hypothetical protein
MKDTKTLFVPVWSTGIKPCTTGLFIGLFMMPKKLQFFKMFWMPDHVRHDDKRHLPPLAEGERWFSRFILRSEKDYFSFNMPALSMISRKSFLWSSSHLIVWSGGR